MTPPVQRTLQEIRTEFAHRATTARQDAVEGNLSRHRGRYLGWDAAVVACRQVADQIHDDDTAALTALLGLLEENVHRLRALSAAQIGSEERAGRAQALKTAIQLTSAAITATLTPPPPPRRRLPGREDDLSDWSAYPKIPFPDDELLTDMDRLAMWLGGSGDSFTGDLLRLILKADPINLNQLAIAYPRHVRAALLWKACSPVPSGTLRELLKATSNFERRNPTP